MSFIGGLFSKDTRPDDVKDFIKSPGLQENNPFTQGFNENAAQQQALAQQLGGFANNGAQGQSAAQQQGFVNQLTAQANGQGPSVSQALLNNALASQVGNTNALAASSRGNMNPVLAQRMAMQQNAQAAQQATQQGAVGRMQEQLNAQGQLGNALSNMRGQDIQNAGMYNQLAQNYQGLGQSAQANAFNAANAELTQKMNANNINASIATGNTAAQNQATGNIVGGLISGGAQVMAKGAAAGAYTGGIIPGKSEIEGDSVKNDKVPMMLSPGEIVIPKTMASDAEKAKAFVDHLLSSKGKAADKTGYAKVLEAQNTMKEMNTRLKKIESKLGSK